MSVNEKRRHLIVNIATLCIFQLSAAIIMSYWLRKLMRWTFDRHGIVGAALGVACSPVPASFPPTRWSHRPEEVCSFNVRSSSLSPHVLTPDGRWELQPSRNFSGMVVVRRMYWALTKQNLYAPDAVRTTTHRPALVIRSSLHTAMSEKKFGIKRWAILIRLLRG